MKVRNSRAGGFTMVELMIAVAIVAILAAMALPMYHSHTVRARVTECIGLATSPKLAVSEALSSGRGINYEFTPTRYCENIQVANSGTIVMNTRDTGASTEPVLQLVPAIGGTDSNIQWDCQVIAGRPAHVPSSCRAQGTLPDLSSDADGLFAMSDSGSGSGASGSGASGSSSSGSSSSGSSSTGGDSSGSGSPSGDSSGSGSSGSGSSDGSSSNGSSSDGSSSDGSSSNGSSSDGSSSDGGSSGGGSSGGGSSGGGSSGGGSSGGGSSGGSSSGGSSSGGSSSGGSSSGGSSSGGSSSGGGSSGGSSSGDGSSDDDGDAEEEKECPYKKRDGSPHPGKCKKWERQQG